MSLPRYFHSDAVSKGLLGELEMDFYETYIRSFYDMTGIDPSWQPRSRRRLLRAEDDRREPEIDTASFPPRLTQSDLGCILEDQYSERLPLVSENLATEMCRGISPEKKFCNLVLLTDGPPQAPSLAGTWLLHHLLPKPETLEGDPFLEPYRAEV